MRKRLTIRNHTEYDTEEVKKLVRFAMAPTKPGETIVVVGYTKQKVRGDRRGYYSGTAYRLVPGEKQFKPIPKGAWYAIKLSISRPETYPSEPLWRWGGEWNYNPAKEWPLFELKDWKEALVMLAAHEAKHNEYQRAGISQRGKGHELRCELFALEMLTRYRGL